jgi:hypothetical protein
VNARPWRCRRCQTELSMSIAGVVFCSQCHRRGHEEIEQVHKPVQQFISRTHSRLQQEQLQREGEAR